MSEKLISVTLTQQHDYRFDICFDDSMPVVTSDERVLAQFEGFCTVT